MHLEFLSTFKSMNPATYGDRVSVYIVHDTPEAIEQYKRVCENYSSYKETEDGSPLYFLRSKPAIIKE